jgi:alpha 1,6-mannosyltransferase
MLNDYGSCTSIFIWYPLRICFVSIETLFSNNNHNLQRSDMFRYLVLLVEGGIYSDTDTRLLKAFEKWGANAIVYTDPTRDGDAEDDDDYSYGEASGKAVGPPSLIVGVEADV